MDQPRWSDDLESTLLWITTGYRLFSAVWLSILGVVVVAGESTQVERPAVVTLTVVGVVGWAVLATGARIRTPSLARSWGFVAVDLAIGAWTVMAGTVAGTIQFAGGYPLAGAFAAIYAFSTTGGIVGAAILTAAGLVPLLGQGQGLSQEVANAIAFLFSVGAATGVAATLRASDRRRVEAEAALAKERAERVRAEEHAEVAAHLHDSVLQTLALIQRDSNATPDIRGLARHQERELRGWLFPDQATAARSPGGFREALLAACAEAEDLGSTKVEVVVVGDTGAATETIISAANEAIRNAQTHSGAELISVYGEVGEDEVLVFVKDRGQGFDPEAVDPSRHGVRESIVGRMDRSGGSAEIISSPGAGTEIRLRLPIEQS
ncbi:MAG: ATP-binding protein [Acidimicrobiia bacterium]|nr:ATP-binding protein [Acidimicrobiia bacterium]